MLKFRFIWDRPEITLSWSNFKLEHTARSLTKQTLYIAWWADGRLLTVCVFNRDAAVKPATSHCFHLAASLNSDVCAKKVKGIISTAFDGVKLSGDSSLVQTFGYFLELCLCNQVHQRRIRSRSWIAVQFSYRPPSGSVSVAEQSAPGRAEEDVDSPYLYKI